MAAAHVVVEVLNAAEAPVTLNDWLCVATVTLLTAGLITGICALFGVGE